MKKRITIVVLGLLLLITLVACDNRSEGVKNVDKLLSQLGDVNEESGDAVYMLVAAWGQLSEEEKEQVGADKYGAILEGYAKYAAEDAIQCFVNHDFESGRDILLSFDDYLSDKQKEQAMLEYGRRYSFDYVEQQLIRMLKNPASYIYNNATLTVGPNSTTDEKVKSDYLASATITYQGTNSFGGYVTNTYTGYTYFDVDYDNYKLVNFRSFYDIFGR